VILPASRRAADESRALRAEAARATRHHGDSAREIDVRRHLCSRRLEAEARRFFLLHDVDPLSCDRDRGREAHSHGERTHEG